MPTFHLFSFFAQVAAVIVTCALTPGFRITGILGPILLVIALSAINTFYWDPDLFYTIPDSLSLQTIMLVLVNGVIFWVLVKLLPDLEITGILPAIVAPLVFTVSSLLISTYGKDIDFQLVGEWISDFIGDTFFFLKRLVGAGYQQ